MKSFKRVFRTAEDALRWLRPNLRRFPSWKDNTRFTADEMTLRCDYPIRLKLPRHAVFVGFEGIESRLPTDLFVNPDLQQLRELSKVARVADLFELFAYYHRPGVKRSERAFGYGGAKGWTRVRFFNPCDSRAGVPAKIEAYQSLFKALELQIRIVQREKKFQFVTSARVQIEGNCWDSDGFPDTIAISYEERKPGQGMQQLSRHIHENGWEIIPTGIFHPRVVGGWQGPRLPVSPRAMAVIKHLNAAALPIKKLTADLWCTVTAWDKLETIAELAAMDRERINFDLNIIAVKLGPKLDGWITASPRKRGFEIGIYPTDTAIVDEDAFGEALRKLQLPD